VKEAALGSGGGDAQFAGGFPDGAFLQLANLERRANSRTESAESVSQHPRPLALGVTFLGIERAVDEMEAGTLVPFLIHELHWHFTRVTIAAQLHQRCIDGDSGEPGGQPRSSIKIVQVHQAAQETFLERIFGVLVISGDTQSGVENFL